MQPSNSQNMSGWAHEYVKKEEPKVKQSSIAISPAPQHPTSAFRRRLKAQQSLPNVKVSAAGRSQSSSVVPTQPWPTNFDEEKLTPYSRLKTEDQGYNDSFSSNSSSSSSSKVLSIDEIIRRHSPGVSPMSKSSSGSLGYGRRSQHSQSQSTSIPRLKERRGGGSDAESEASDGSLDSIEKEIRHSMRLNKQGSKGHENVRNTPTLASSSNLTSSPSTSTLFGKKKSSPSMMNPVSRLRTLSTNNATVSSSSADSAMSNFGPQALKKNMKTGVPSSSSASLFTVPTPSSPALNSPPSSFTSNDQDTSIRDYVRSKRLTSLMTLSRHPYEGQTVSFADVGDENGHPVFVFLGLGAVRYLVALYDEMASVLKLRLICIDRWGLGKTDDLSAEQRGVLEWSNVVAEVADRLGVRRFSVLAHSAGAPYAMATCLVHEHRIAGPVHLLAPWVSPTIESGYKWLKYIPDGIIKTAQAADWKMQAWKLGVSKAPTLVFPKEEEGEEEKSSLKDAGRSDQRWSSTMNSNFDFLPPLTLQSFDNEPLTATPTQSSSYNKRVARPAPLNLELDRHDHQFEDEWSATTDTFSTSAMGSSPPTSTAPTFSGAESSLTSRDSLVSLPSLPSNASLKSTSTSQDSLRGMKGGGVSVKKSHFSLRRSPSSSQMTLSDVQSKPLPLAPFARPSIERSASSPWTSPSIDVASDQSPSSLDLTTALLRASHSESLRGGGTNDLLVILGRSSQKPWGFTYTDVSHSVIVWHGEKDERISLSSILWMEREMRHCSVNFVKGATHGLMTNVGVVIEALER